MIQKISNPLTIIGIFASIVEVSSVVVLPQLSDSLQVTFLNFVIWFPVLLIVLFFLTLNFNPLSLYAPGDYTDEKVYLELMKLKHKIKETMTSVSTSDSLGSTSNLASSIDRIIDSSAPAKLSIRILKELELGPKSSNQLAAALNISLASAHRSLSRLGAEGLIQKFDSGSGGKWTLNT